MCVSNLTATEAVERGKTHLSCTVIFLLSDICFKRVVTLISAEGTTSAFVVCSLPALLIWCNQISFDMFSLGVTLDTSFWLSWSILQYCGQYFPLYVTLKHIKGVQLTKCHSGSCLLATDSVLFYLTTSNFLVLSSFQSQCWKIKRWKVVWPCFKSVVTLGKYLLEYSE